MNVYGAEGWKTWPLHHLTIEYLFKITECAMPRAYHLNELDY